MSGKSRPETLKRYRKKRNIVEQIGRTCAPIFMHAVNVKKDLRIPLADLQQITAKLREFEEATKPQPGK